MDDDDPVADRVVVVVERAGRRLGVDQLAAVADAGVEVDDGVADLAVAADADRDLLAPPSGRISRCWPPITIERSMTEPERTIERMPMIESAMWLPREDAPLAEDRDSAPSSRSP